MKVNQIYSLLNDINHQMYGADALDVNDLQGIISMGKTIVGDGEMWGGVPAKFIKKVDPEQARELNKGIAQHYIMYADWYRDAKDLPDPEQTPLNYKMICSSMA